MHKHEPHEMDDDMTDTEIRRRRQRVAMNGKIIRLVSIVIISLFLAHLLRTYL